eukprot:3349648-Rhodomonas_salina.1
MNSLERTSVSASVRACVRVCVSACVSASSSFVERGTEKRFCVIGGARRVLREGGHVRSV